MELEQQVVSLELAKNLKELGVKQLNNSLWAWAFVAQAEKDEMGRPKWEYEIVANDFQADLEFIAAFTVAELGEMMPEYVSYTKHGLGYASKHKEFIAESKRRAYKSRASPKLHG